MYLLYISSCLVFSEIDSKIPQIAKIRLNLTITCVFEYHTLLDRLDAHNKRRYSIFILRF